jgi:outer membrane beta-barrel protein
MRVIAAVALALSLSAIGGIAAAQDEEEGLRTLAVQPRHRHHWHELSASIGVLPLNAFVKGLTVGGNYTLHFNHLFAWEIVRAFGVVSEIETGLNGDLNELQLSPTPYEYPEWAATSSFIFTPFFGKLAVVNRALIFSEVFLVAGVGYGWLTNSQHVVIDTGLGVRVFFGEYFSIRLDVRWEGFVAGIGELHNELSLMLGIAVHLG